MLNLGAESSPALWLATFSQQGFYAQVLRRKNKLASGVSVWNFSII